MPAQEIYSEWAKTLAEQLVASGDAPPAGLSDDERLALAWALKDLAIRGWSNAPASVPKAENLLMALSETVEVKTQETGIEVQAVAAWVAGIAALTRGRMTEAILYIETAAKHFEELGQTANAAHSRVSRIVALSMLGQHAEAAACGVSTQRELLDLGDLHAAGKVSLNLGNLFYRQNVHQLALNHYGDAMKLFEETGDANLLVVAQTGAANVHESMGNFDQALDAYSVISEYSRNNGLHAHEAVVLESIALLHLARGNHTKALDGLEIARRLYEKLCMAQNLANSEKQLADAYLAIKLVPEALTLLDRAISRFDELGMPVEQGWAMTQRGRALVALQRPPAEISETLLRASGIFSSCGVTAGTATVLMARAELALSFGDAKLALELAVEATNVFRAADLVADSVQADVVRAHALLRGGKTSDATALFTATLDQAREMQLVSIVVRCQIGLGLALQSNGQTHAAKLSYESAIESFEEQRDALPGDDLRHAFLVDHLRPYEELLRIAMRECDATHSALLASDVLMRLERFRARALGERLGDEHERDGATGNDGVAQDLRTRLNWLNRRADKLLNEGHRLAA